MVTGCCRGFRFVVSMVNYGIVFNAVNLSGSVYVTVLLYGVATVASFLYTRVRDGAAVRRRHRRVVPLHAGTVPKVPRALHVGTVPKVPRALHVGTMPRALQAGCLWGTGCESPLAAVRHGHKVQGSVEGCESIGVCGVCMRESPSGTRLHGPVWAWLNPGSAPAPSGSAPPRVTRYSVQSCAHVVDLTASVCCSVRAGGAVPGASVEPVRPHVLRRHLPLRHDRRA